MKDLWCSSTVYVAAKKKKKCECSEGLVQFGCQKKHRYECGEGSVVFSENSLAAKNHMNAVNDLHVVL